MVDDSDSKALIIRLTPDYSAHAFTLLIGNPFNCPYCRVHFVEGLYREQKLNLARNRIAPGSRAFITPTSRAESSLFTAFHSGRLGHLDRGASSAKDNKMGIQQRRLGLAPNYLELIRRKRLCAEMCGFPAEFRRVGRLPLSPSRDLVNNFSPQ
jgi:hypothetical protein